MRLSAREYPGNRLCGQIITEMLDPASGAWRDVMDQCLWVDTGERRAYLYELDANGRKFIRDGEAAGREIHGAFRMRLKEDASEEALRLAMDLDVLMPWERA